MGMTFEEKRRTDIAPCQLQGAASGWCLVVLGNAADVVLSGQSRHRQWRTPVASSDEHGRLNCHSAAQVVRYIARLWNERAAQLRGESPPAPSAPVEAHLVCRADDPGPHEYTIRSPFRCGDEVLSDEYHRGTVGLVTGLEFRVFPPDTVERKAYVRFGDHGALGIPVEKLRKAPPKVDVIAQTVTKTEGRPPIVLTVGDRVKTAPQNGSYGTLIGLSLLGGRGGPLVAEVLWDDGEAQRNIAPEFLKPAL